MLIWVIACCWITLTFGWACSIPGGSTTRGPAESAKRSGSQDVVLTSKDPLETKFFEGDPKGAEAWRQFLVNSKYRLAQSEDFRFSDATGRQLEYIFGREWKSRAFNPYTGGDINHDQYFHDIAFLVVDRTRTDSRRFGLVIFNEQPGDRPHNQYWLYTKRDLSRTVFGWASSGLHIDEFDEQGRSTTCYVNWHESSQEYTCDKSPKLRG